MKLIICEKPDLARKVVSALKSIDNISKTNGYYLGNDYIVTNAFGHLFGLYDVEEYLDKAEPCWTMNILPFFPDKFKFRLLKDKKTKETDIGIKKQYELICRLMNDSETDEIIHCGDADREGECIIRLIIQAGLKEKKKVSRLWLPDQTEETIIKSIRERKSDSDYDNLAREGMARIYIDWITGINLTRYLSIKSGTLMRAGRVILAIVKEIYDREQSIANFVPAKFLGIDGEIDVKGKTIKLTASRKFALNEGNMAKEYCEKLNQNGIYVDKVERKRVIKTSGKLFSLTTLQSMLAGMYKMSPDVVLSNLQTLYEKGYVTYPRTNTEYLSEAEKGRIGEIIDVFNSQGKKLILKENRSIFDDTKIESHSALTPTHVIPDSSLSENEKKVYECIKNRFCAVFCEEKCEVDKTVMLLTDGEETFELIGEILIKEGFMIYEKKKLKENMLPELSEGEQIAVTFKPEIKQTTPPKRYTVESLNNFMENPFSREKKKNDEENYKDLFDGVEIGTVGTRAGIIKNAQDNGYISLKNNYYYMEPAGNYLMNLLEELQINITKEKTVEMSKELKKVYKGERSINDAVELQKNEISKMFECRDKTVQKIVTKTDGLGICPKCGGMIRKGKNNYYCSNYKEGCKFALWFNDRFFEAINVPLTDKLVWQLLDKKKALVKLTSKKDNKKYSAYVEVDFSGQYPAYHIVYNRKKGKKKGE